MPSGAGPGGSPSFGTVGPKCDDGAALSSELAPTRRFDSIAHAPAPAAASNPAPIHHSLREGRSSGDALTP